MRKRRWIAGMLATALAVTLLAPAAAFAEDSSAYSAVTAERGAATTESAAGAEQTVPAVSEEPDSTETGLVAPPVTATPEQAAPFPGDIAEERPVGITVMADEAQAKNAAQPWDGITADTDWYRERPEAISYTLSTPAQLAGLAQLVNEGSTSFQGKTVLLEGDIDLNGQEWTPIGGTDTGKTFAGTFDGQGHVISHLKITRGAENTGANNRVGLFGAGTGAAKIQNFTLQNAEVSGCLQVAAVLGGSGGAEARVTNVHVTGRINVRGWWYVGGIMGKGYSTITGCSVQGDGPDASAVAITGGYAGGIVGFMGEDNCVTSNCTVKNITVSGAYNGIGGVNGILHYGNTIRDCTVENVVVWQTAEPDEDTGRIYVGAFGGTYLDNDGKNPPALENCSFQGAMYSGAAKEELREEHRYVGSLWYGAEPPATVHITNCTIRFAEKPAEPTPAPPADNDQKPAPAPAVTPGPSASPTPAPTVEPAATPTPMPVTASPAPVVPSRPAVTPIPAAAETPVPLPADKKPGNVTAVAQVNDSRAVAAVDAASLEQAVNQVLAEAKAAQAAPAVTVEVTADRNVRAVEVVLPVQALRLLAEQEQAEFTVASQAAQVTFDRTALAAIADQADGRVVLTVTPVAEAEMSPAQAQAAQGNPTFELTLRSGDRTISSFREGSARITLPHVLAEGQQPAGVVVWYLADDGQISACETTYDAQAQVVTFVTPHFSRYAIAYDESLVAAPDRQEAPAVPDAGQDREPAAAANSVPWLPALLLTAAAVIAVLIARRYRKAG